MLVMQGSKTETTCGVAGEGADVEAGEGDSVHGKYKQIRSWQNPWANGPPREAHG
jgi:hypothetical protein